MKKKSVGIYTVHRFPETIIEDYQKTMVPNKSPTARGFTTNNMSITQAAGCHKPFPTRVLIRKALPFPDTLPERFDEARTVRWTAESKAITKLYFYCFMVPNLSHFYRAAHMLLLGKPSCNVEYRYMHRYWLFGAIILHIISMVTDMVTLRSQMSVTFCNVTNM